jgi:nitrite reductase (NO-forming)
MGRIAHLILSIGFLLSWSAGAGGEVPSKAGTLERITQTLVAPPFVPAHTQVAEGAPRVVQVRMVIEEKLLPIGPDGAKVWAMTFNGTVPGPLVVVHQDDYVELTLENPKTNTLLHNIDFHAATGALGGGELTHVAPGQEVVLRFKATKPGVFVYHCAPGGVMIPWHVVSGMNGAIMVLPRDGLRDAEGHPVRYDRAYYIGEQDFYIPKNADGKYKEYAAPIAGMGDMLEVMKTLTPTHVVFNGAVGALTGDHALTAKVGERVLFIHAQANRDSRPHLIGGHADLVWQGGSFEDKPATNLETWFVAGGSAVAAMYQFRQPGLYVYLNHNLIEAMLLGAAAQVKVEGEWNNDLMEQVQKPGPIKAP